ncbi:MAG: transaldolase family protein [Cyanobacteria bacterium J06632_3]
MSAQSIFSYPHLRLYLDTADVSAWQTWLPTGLFYGVTCNPSLLAKAKVPCEPGHLKAMAQTAFDLGAQEVHLQAWGDSVVDLLRVGQRLGDADERIVVKLPATREGTTAAKALVQSSIPVTLTAVYAVHQALIAAAVGASYVAPYLGRMNDAGQDGREVIATMQQILQNVSSSTRILTASIRNIEDISALAAQGVDTFTFSEKIARAFFDVSATIKATADFEAAAKGAI